MSRRADRVVLSAYRRLSQTLNVQDLISDIPSLTNEIYRLHSGRSRVIERPEEIRELYTALADSYLERKKVVGVKQERDSSCAYFMYNGIRVKLPAPSTNGTAKVTLPCCFPNRSPGFFSLESITESGALHGQPSSRLYVPRADWTEALLDFKAFITWMDEYLFGSWSAKIASSTAGYPSNDAIVIYLPKESVSIVENEISNILPFRDTVCDESPFTRPIGNGVFVADEPNRLRGRNLSFGEHRAQLIAEVLVNVLKYNAGVREFSMEKCKAMGISFDDISENL